MKALFSFLSCWNKIFTLITSNWIAKVCVTKELSNVFNLTKESNQHGPSLSLSTSQSFNLFKLLSSFGKLYINLRQRSIDTIVAKVRFIIAVLASQPQRHATQHRQTFAKIGIITDVDRLPDRFQLSFTPTERLWGCIFLHFVAKGRRYIQFNVKIFNGLRRDPGC